MSDSIDRTIFTATETIARSAQTLNRVFANEDSTRRVLESSRLAIERSRELLRRIKSELIAGRID